jgi:hypothetical protein
VSSINACVDITALYAPKINFSRIINTDVKFLALNYTKMLEGQTERGREVFPLSTLLIVKTK